MSGKSVKKNTKNSSLKTFLKVFFAVFFAGAIISIVCLLAVGYSFIISTPAVDDNNLAFTSVVYYADPKTGKDVEFEHLYKNSNRRWVDLADIPDYVQKAAIAIEDERFYKHFGFDVKSTSKAAFEYVIKRSTSRGASTITQQLVKNLTGEGQKTPLRKVQEIIRAVSLERRMSKDQILELYLNTIYLSQGCSGISSASDYYFGKDVKDLTVAEGACLIGITQYPTLYDPILNPKKNKEKQELILKKMLELGYIDQKTYDDSVAEKLVFKPKKGENAYEGKQSYFVDEIVRQILNDMQTKLGYSEDDAVKELYAGGLKIYSTLDPEVQDAVDNVYENESNFPKAPSSVQPQSSITIIDPATGEVRGLSGGIGPKNASRVLNRATQTYRQPGSTIKPLAVYGPALDRKLISPGTVYTDKKVTYGTWSPKNYYSGFKGAMTVRHAVELSVNTIPVQILEKMGTNISYDYLENKLGFTSLENNDKNLSALALGGLTKGVTNMELTAAYATFANKGVYNRPILYTKVVDNSGKVILENSPKPITAFSEQAANMMTDMMMSVVRSGTGTAANFSGSYSIAGKTGTTDNDVDRWFVGMTPYYVGAVWYGYDSPRDMGYLVSNPTIPVWKKIMQEIHKTKKLPSKYFKTGSYSYGTKTSKVSICIDSGLLATNACINAGRAKTEYFTPGSEPKNKCPLLHNGENVTPGGTENNGESETPSESSENGTTTQKVAPTIYKICSASGLLATPYCPPELIISSTKAPSGYCTIHTRKQQ